ncbi:NADH-quinone oxidoreductase subunit C [Escherichia coli]
MNNLLGSWRFLKETAKTLRPCCLTYTAWTNISHTPRRVTCHRFSVFYHLISINSNRDIMLKVALAENDLHVPTFTKLFPNANWYEREARSVWHLLSTVTRTCAAS